MRFRLPMGRRVFFLCAFLFALVALLPLRLALGWLALDGSGLAAREVSGSIWMGALREAHAAGAPLGDLRARLDPLPLLTGRARVDLDRLAQSDVAVPLEGAVSVTRHSLGIDDATASLPLGELFAPLPISALDLADVTVRFRDGLCERADGLVKARLSGEIAGLSLPAGFSGTARCDAGAVLLPLVSQGGSEMLSLWIERGGRYRAELAMRPGDEAGRTRLLASGFTPAGDRLRIAVQGSF
ncbi:MAG: type secretion system protein [Sphingomonas bacterium]|jgi:general secretion pathway protein N|nr:type secretion system protein [Sphingomonas bacterium]MDB5718860.1 type secretion system protein [Sphingomonas bacterium]